MNNEHQDNKTTYITDIIYKRVCTVASFVTLYVYLIFYRIVSFVLKHLGYTRVYDLTTGADLTMLYLIFNCVRKASINIPFDISYPRLGVCTYIGEKYVRYVCYNTRLSDVIKPDKVLSAKNYHNVKKLEYSVTQTNDLEEIFIDITSSKNQLYDVNNFTRPEDIVRFYTVMNGYDLSSLGKNFSIRLHKEYFDDSMLEFVSITEEIKTE